MTTNKNKTPDYLIFQAVQCAENYSDYDVKAMLSALSDDEKKLLQKHLNGMTGAKTNDRIIRAIAVMQDLADMKQKVSITDINPKGVQNIPVRIIS